MRFVKSHFDGWDRQSVTEHYNPLVRRSWSVVSGRGMDPVP